ncbi:MAG: aldehyde ferredoxin oxidoreductase family protein [Actinomycetota bacterium]
MNGWAGRILRVDLTSGSVTSEPLDPALAHAYIGGRGLNARILYDEVGVGVDPLGPGNKLILGVGPCSGTPVPGSQRFTVSMKSPATGLYADSNCGGSFGATLKYAGYDVLIVEGASPEPVYLWIDDDRVEIRPAEHLWGTTTREAARAIVLEVGDPDVSTLAIGPAGENLVAYASVIADLGRALGRTGVGAVFGSKRLKAVAARGTRGVRVADPRALATEIRRSYEAWDANREMYDLIAAYGPSRGALRYGGLMGDRNFRGGDPTGWLSMMSFENQADRYVKTRACFSCPQACDHMYVVTRGPFTGAYGQGMELSQPLDLGVRLGLYDLDAVLAAGTLADEYGLDYFDCSAAIGFAMECYERGLLDDDRTDGLRLEWGSQDAIPRLIEMIARREGIGDLLSGPLDAIPGRVGEGAEDLMIHTKGITFAGRDARASKGWGLSYAVSSRGACHIRAFIPESMPDHGWDVSVRPVLERYLDATNPVTEEGKPELVYWYENLLAFKNSLEICLFTSDPWMFAKDAEQFSMAGMVARLCNATTGLDLTEEDVLTIGERIVNIERAFNVREGLTRADDTLPKRMRCEPMPDGFAAGQVVDLDPMLDEYYRFRGWDTATGLPTRARLLELGLADVADDLHATGRLAP